MWQLTFQKGKPQYEQIMFHIIQLSQKGQLKLGEKLPSERKLAEIMGVNRSTIVHALNELVAMEVIERKKGSGTYLIKVVKDAQKHEKRWRFSASKDPFLRQENLKEQLQKKKNQRNFIDAFTGELPVDLAPKISLPQYTWEDFLKEESQESLLGYTPLRKILSEKKWPLESILITSGAQQGLLLILLTLLKAGDKVGLLYPSFFWSLDLFPYTEIKRIPLTKVATHLDFAEIKKEINKHRLKVLLVNPTFQNPTGWQMSLADRKKLVVLAKAEEILIIEDDAFKELSYPETTNYPTLHDLAPEQVLYLGSLSKVLGTTTKIGWVLGSTEIIKKLAATKKEMELTLSIFPQVLATSALTATNWPQQLALLQANLSQQSKYLKKLLEKAQLGKVVGGIGGYYLWLEDLPKAVNEKLLKKMLAENFLVQGGYIFLGKENTLRINVAPLTYEKSEILVEKLKKFFNR